MVAIYCFHCSDLVETSAALDNSASRPSIVAESIMFSGCPSVPTSLTNTLKGILQI